MCQTGGHSSTDVVATDFDNDGSADLFIVNYEQPNQLLLNDGTGNFIAVAVGDAVEGSFSSQGVTAGDFDGDGSVDLFIVNGPDGPGVNQPNQLLLNDGAAVFVAATSGSAVEASDDSRAVAMADFNRDGQIDIYVANFEQPNQLMYSADCPDDGFAPKPVRWAQMDGLACTAPGTFGEFATQALAQAACLDDPQCRGVFDAACDGQGMWTACAAPQHTWVPSINGSCMHRKQPQAGCCKSSALSATRLMRVCDRAM